jgi:hypothetical protein
LERLAYGRPAPPLWNAVNSNLRLCRNGVEVDSKPYHELHRDPRIKALAIGAKLNLLGTAPEERDFNVGHGSLDELAIFNYALTESQILDLCVLANASD